MRIVLINPPLRNRAEVHPLGLLSLVAVLRSHGHPAAICDVDHHRFSINQVITHIQNYGANAIGISGKTATTYQYIKELAQAVRCTLPELPIILGGSISACGELLLRQTCVDAVIYGEGEVSLPALLTRIEHNESIATIPGIMYRHGAEIVHGPPQRLIKNLNTLPLPAYDAVDMDAYLGDITTGYKTSVYRNDPRVAGSSPARPRSIEILSSRGCTGTCTFCHRFLRGIRRYSVDYVLDHIAYLQQQYNIGFIDFGDESFTSHRAWVEQFIAGVRSRQLSFFFRIYGARVDTVDYDLLSELKAIGCVSILYGFESGSQRILNQINKRVTVEENIRVHRMTLDIGLQTVPQLVVGMPDERQSTIDETIKALRQIGAPLPSPKTIKFAMALPGTWLWDYACSHGFITDPDDYLSRVSNGENDQLWINFTQLPDEVVLGWPDYIVSEVNSWLR